MRATKVTWRTVVKAGMVVIPAVSLLVDLLNAEGLIRSALRQYRPTFPKEVTIKPIEMTSLSSYVCAANDTFDSLKVMGVSARLIINKCQEEMNNAVKVLRSKFPSDVISKASYTIVINGLKTDIKKLTLFAGGESQSYSAILPGTVLAHCNTVTRHDHKDTIGARLNAVEVVLEHNGTPVRLELETPEPSERRALADSECRGVFTYPH